MARGQRRRAAGGAALAMSQGRAAAGPGVIARAARRRRRRAAAQRPSHGRAQKPRGAGGYYAVQRRPRRWRQRSQPRGEQEEVCLPRVL